MLRFLLDRTAILFLGVAAGVAIGYAFGTGGARKETVEIAPTVAPVAQAPASIAPPPPAGSVAAPEAKVAPALPSPAAPPPQPEKAALPAPVADGHVVRVGVFGDSFGDGIWSALYRLLPAKDGFEVAKYSQQSTGFTRYARLNLEAHDEGRLADAPVNIAVIAFGANDAQGVCDEGHCGKLMGTFWQKVIGARVTSYVAMLRRHGAAVYWVGLPVMRDESFDADAHAMDAFYRQLMASLDVPFVDIRPLTADGSGHYEAYYDDGAGGQKLFRANDGIHMSMNGYLHVTRGLAQVIRASVADARGVKPDARPDEPAGAPQ